MSEVVWKSTDGLRFFHESEIHGSSQQVALFGRWFHCDPRDPHYDAVQQDRFALILQALAGAGRSLQADHVLRVLGLKGEAA